jgi:release factor glutamine methyltransferase
LPDLAGKSVSLALEQAAVRLSDAGIERPHHEARLLLAHASELTMARQIADPDLLLDDASETQFKYLIARRALREPISHLVGEREFWSLAFRVSSAVLDPRPDSETLIEAALKFFSEDRRDLSVLDLGTGSGCLLLTILAQRPTAIGLGVDLSPDALHVASQNADRLALTDRVNFVCGDWGAALGRPFDLILCNPPYIKTGDLAQLEPEVARYEPLSALDGGADGLQAYRTLLPQLRQLMRAESAAFLEIGVGQTGEITPLVEKSGLHLSHIYRDFSGIERCFVVTL